MKTSRFLLAMISCCTLMHGLSFAEPPPQQPQQAPSVSHSKTGNDRLSTIQTNREKSGEKRANGAQTRSIAGNGLRQSALSKSASAPTYGFMMNKIESHHDRPARLPVGGGFTVPSTNAVRRRRGPVSAIIGGVAKSSAGNTTAINGTGMTHKP